MNDDQLLIKVQADASGYLKVIKQLRKETAVLEKQAKSIKIGGSTAAITQAKAVGAARIAQEKSVYSVSSRLTGKQHAQKMANIKKEAAAQEQAVKKTSLRR